MSEVVQLVPEPMAPCKDCVENHRHQEETIGIVYCHHHRYGGVYTAENGLWQITGPFESESAFKRALHFNLMQLLAQKSVSR